MNFNAKTIKEARAYLIIRYYELISIGIFVIKEFNYKNKAIISTYDNGYSSIYILEQYRGQGLYQKLVEKYSLDIITIQNCNIVDYLSEKGIKYIVATPSKAYLKIRDYYGDTTTKRSKIPLINHINEGLVVLNKIGADQETKDAYCLHPLLQSDEKFLNHYKDDFRGISTSSIILAVEYRRVANSYLSTGKPENLVPFVSASIYQMLFADKIQNEKDFKLYHEKTHERSKELRKYFDNWFKILNINLNTDTLWQIHCMHQ